MAPSSTLNLSVSLMKEEMDHYRGETHNGGNPPIFRNEIKASKNGYTRFTELFSSLFMKASHHETFRGETYHVRGTCCAREFPSCATWVCHQFE